MDFHEPAVPSDFDTGRVLGRAHTRVDGPAKVTGKARYASERHDVAPDAAVGWIVPAPIAFGRLRRVGTGAALAAPGVLAVVTAENAGRLHRADSNAAPLLAGPRIVHYHQAVAVVVAETLEQARAAAALVELDCEAEPGRFDLAGERERAVSPGKIMGHPADTRVGDFERAFEASPVRVDRTYTTPHQSHQMMEPHATTAMWKEGQLIVWTSNQMIADSRAALAKTLGLPVGKVRMISPYVGGGFGAKLWVRADALLAALGARAAKRPLKLALPRPLVANNTLRRSATIQRLRLGADREGRLRAIAHETWSGNVEHGKPEAAALQTRLLYAGEHRLTTHRLARLDLTEANAMRAPGEAAGMLALEIAMDELAEACGMDPVELRLRNDTAWDPEAGPKRPFSSRRFAECLRVGAQRFGWQGRGMPRTRREGRWWIGTGMAAAYRGSPVEDSGARVSLRDDGSVLVETDMTDIGTGSYTILAQTAAEVMKVPLDRVEVRLGDSDLPESCGSGGQIGGNSSASGVYAACVKLRDQLARGGPRTAEDRIRFGDLSKRYALSTFGAHFCEVAVDADTGETRVRRMLGVYSAGRILNPVTARSQLLGGMCFGIGAALMEELAVDPRRGFFVNHDLAGYHVPVHADIGELEAIILHDEDDKSSPLRSKGVGELGISGAGAAIANAIHDACGVRLRDYPMTPDRLLQHPDFHGRRP